jgi:hypothetical protein
MVDIRRLDVPFYLQEGEFFKSLSQEDDLTICVPASALKNDVSVQSDEDLLHLLNSLRFWIVDYMPDVVLEYLWLRDLQKGQPLLQEFCGTFPQADAITTLIKLPQTARMPYAVKMGDVRLVKFLEGRDLPLSKGMDVTAAEAGHLDVLRYVSSKVGFAYGVDCAAIKSGHLDCFRFIEEARGIEHSSNCRLCDVAAQYGRLHCLIYLQEHGYHWGPGTCAKAAEFGHLDCLQYAHEHGCPWDHVTVMCAVKHWSCLQYAVTHGAPLSSYASAEAAQQVDTAALQYLHDNGCPWSSTVCYYAASKGRLACLQYAHEHGCAWDSRTTRFALEAGHFDCAKYAYEHGCPVDPFICNSFADHNRLDALKFAHVTLKQSVTEYTAMRAALGGHLEVLTFLHEHGCPWDSTTCTMAALEGHLGCLEYAHEHGCAWDAHTIAAAALGNNLRCLQYLHENCCTWDAQTFAFAIRGSCNAHYTKPREGTHQISECLLYCMAHACPIDASAVYYAHELGHSPALEVLLKAGWKVDDARNYYWAAYYPG